MNEREKELLRMAVIYAIANIDDVVEAFETEESQEKQFPMRQLSVDGCFIDEATEEELSLLLKHF
jgi:hypothetical protein